MATSTKTNTKHCWMTDTETSSDDGIESRIQFYLEAYRHYIVQCINTDDLLFYEHFSPEIRKYFRKLSKSGLDGTSVTSEMIDTIITMENPGRFSALVKLFEDEFENEKVSRILKGEKTPTNRRENKEKIQKLCTQDICKNLNVIEIIPYLIQNNLILENEGTALKSVAENEKHILAAFDLLFIIPHRHSHWYTRFLTCLVKSGHADLAKLIDKEFYEKITLDLSTRSTKLERPIDYHDEQMSLVSGSVTMRPKFLKDVEDTRPTSTTDHKGKTLNPQTTNKGVSPEHERVTKWLNESQDMGENSDNEKIFSTQSHKKPKFKKRLSNERTSSLLGTRPLLRARSKRHQTLQMPIKQIAILQNFMSYNTQSKASSDDRQSDVSDCSRRNSMISSMDSLDKLCVDETFDLQISVDEIDHNCVNLEMTNILQKISDLERSSDTDETTRVVAEKEEKFPQIAEENTSTNGEISTKRETFPNSSAENIPPIDEEAIKHEHAPKIDRAIQTEAMKKGSFCPNFQQLLTMSFLHPVKLSLLVKEYPTIHNVCTILGWISQRSIEFNDYTLSLKAHYVSTVLQKAHEAGNIDIWIENLLTGREPDGYFVYEDMLIREVLKEYESKETWIYKAIKSEMQQIDTGDGLSSLKVITQMFQRNRDTKTIISNNDVKIKSDVAIACNTSGNAQEAMHHTGKSHGDILPSNKSFDMACNDTKLEPDVRKNNCKYENDRNAQLTTTLPVVKKSKIDEGNATVNDVESETGNINTSRPSICNTSKAGLAVEGKNSTLEESEACNPVLDAKIVYAHGTTSTEENNPKGKDGCPNIIDRVAETLSCDCFSRDEKDLLSHSGASLETLTFDSPEFKVVKEKRFKGCNVKIVCIHRIINENLQSRFLNQKQLIEENNRQGNVQLLFLGTKYLKAVIEGGFDIICAEQGLEEIYFSKYPLVFEEEVKEFDQNSGSNFSQGKTRRRVLLCNVCLGKTKTETSTCLNTKSDENTPSDCYSWITIELINGKKYLKHKILHGDQVNPEYLVTYDTCDTNIR